jgi:hypothetical protein
MIADSHITLIQKIFQKYQHPYRLLSLSHLKMLSVLFFNFYRELMFGHFQQSHSLMQLTDGMHYFHIFFIGNVPGDTWRSTVQEAAKLISVATFRCHNIWPARIQLIYITQQQTRNSGFDDQLEPDKDG